MGAKNKKNNEAEQKNENDNIKKKDNGGNDNITAVLKADLHCDGCSSKFLKCIRSFDGVKTLTIDESQKITVTGKFDPAKLRGKVEEKTHKKPPVTTAVLKVHLHCEGCIQKIHKIVTKTKGYEEMKIDRQKDMVTVAGAMDMKALAETLKKHLKKEVELVLPKKEGGGEKKEKSGGDKGKGGGEDKGKSGSKEEGGGNKGKGGGGGGGDKGKGGGEEEDGGEKMEGNKMQFQFVNPYPSMYGAGQMGEQFQYHPHGYGPYYHAPQIFSDENPNACSVM
ncbi:Heavy metal transport/detoxification superfamily protein [Abeliophyllum distichum]|uniref:Heavy metal transport/detoxification superfamily protein n=1 Tax=Abeliophyllum distichum TaxID=126358 RepID=A0ABD1VUK2_9LAMI